MRISQKGVLEIAEHEGIVLGPYLDSVGVWTSGVGHTAAAGGDDPEKMPRHDTRQFNENGVKAALVRAVMVFDADLDQYEARVNKAIKAPLNQHQFDALVSFDFNTGGIHRANLTKQINAGNMSGEGFMGWLRPKEIIKRRKAEQKLFQTGNYDANGSQIPIYDALGDGRIRFRRNMTGQELADMMPRAKQPSGIIGLIMALISIFTGGKK